MERPKPRLDIHLFLLIVTFSVCPGGIYGQGNVLGIVERFLSSALTGSNPLQDIGALFLPTPPPQRSIASISPREASRFLETQLPRKSNSGTASTGASTIAALARSLGLSGFEIQQLLHKPPSFIQEIPTKIRNGIPRLTATGGFLSNFFPGTTTPTPTTAPPPPPPPRAPAPPPPTQPPLPPPPPTPKPVKPTFEAAFSEYLKEVDIDDSDRSALAKELSKALISSPLFVKLAKSRNIDLNEEDKKTIMNQAQVSNGRPSFPTSPEPSVITNRIAAENTHTSTRQIGGFGQSLPPQSGNGRIGSNSQNTKTISISASKLKELEIGEFGDFGDIELTPEEYDYVFGDLGDLSEPFENPDYELPLTKQETASLEQIINDPTLVETLHHRGVIPINSKQSKQLSRVIPTRVATNRRNTPTTPVPTTEKSIPDRKSTNKIDADKQKRLLEEWHSRVRVGRPKTLTQNWDTDRPGLGTTTSTPPRNTPRPRRRPNRPRQRTRPGSRPRPQTRRPKTDTKSQTESTKNKPDVTKSFLQQQGQRGLVSLPRTERNRLVSYSAVHLYNSVMVREYYDSLRAKSRGNTALRARVNGNRIKTASPPSDKLIAALFRTSPGVTVAPLIPEEAEEEVRDLETLFQRHIKNSPNKKILNQKDARSALEVYIASIKNKLTSSKISDPNPSRIDKVFPNNPSPPRSRFSLPPVAALQSPGSQITNRVGPHREINSDIVQNSFPKTQRIPNSFSIRRVTSKPPTQAPTRKNPVLVTNSLSRAKQFVKDRVNQLRQGAETLVSRTIDKLPGKDGKQDGFVELIGVINRSVGYALTKLAPGTTTPVSVDDSIDYPDLSAEEQDERRTLRDKIAKIRETLKQLKNDAIKSTREPPTILSFTVPPEEDALATYRRHNSRGSSGLTSFRNIWDSATTPVKGVRAWLPPINSQLPEFVPELRPRASRTNPEILEWFVPES